MTTVRESIIEKVQTARQKKLEKKKGCEHVWETFKETVRPDNPNFRGTAYFVLQGCINCHEKRRTTYVVERN